MKEFTAFCQSLKDIIDNHPQLDIEGARKIVQQINEFLYTTHPDIGTIEKFGSKFDYFSDFHKFWHKYHKEILNCEIDEYICEKVADALHSIFIQTNGKAFTSIYDTCGLSDEDVCRVRFLTANQDFRGSRSFSFLADVFECDNAIFDENNILADPEDFLKKIDVGALSQNDKRLKYATNIAQFLLTHKCTPYELIEKYKSDYEIKKLIQEGKIFKIEKGIYSDKKDVNYLEIISKKYPNAIFTMDSAFYYHNLTDVIPEKEHLALKRDSTKISDSRIKVVYYQDKFFDIGKSTLNINGVEVKVYDKERMLIELIRNRKSIGFDYYKEIIANYREIKETLNTKKIAEYISNFAIENHLYDVIMKEVF